MDPIIEKMLIPKSLNNQDIIVDRFSLQIQHQMLREKYKIFASSAFKIPTLTLNIISTCVILLYVILSPIVKGSTGDIWVVYLGVLGGMVLMTLSYHTTLIKENVEYFTIIWFCLIIAIFFFIES